MRKMLLAVMAVLIMAGAVCAETSPCVQPCTIGGRTGGIVTGASAFSSNAASGFSITDAEGDYMVVNTAEGGTVFYNPLANAGGETASSYTTVEGAITNGAIIKNGRNKITFGSTSDTTGANKTGTITSLANTYMFQSANTLSLGAVYGETIRFTPSTGTGAVTMDSFDHFVAGYGGGTGAQAFTIPTLRGFYAEDADTALGGALLGTQTTVIGMQVDKQLTGDTTNIGIWLNGDSTSTAADKGAALVLGASQLSAIFDTGSNLSINRSSGDILLSPSLRITPGTTEIIAAGGTITADKCGAAKIICTGTCAVADGNIATGTLPLTACAGTNAGCRMLLINGEDLTKDTITLDADNAASDMLSIGDLDIVLAPDGMVDFVCADGLWRQVSAVATPAN